MGCASEAPPLPPDTTSINRTHELTLEDFTPDARAMTCDQIAAERQQIAVAMQQANDKIAGNRTRNQVAVGFVSFGAGILAPALLMTDSNEGEKDEITTLYQRQDTLIKLGSLKHCPTPPSSGQSHYEWPHGIIGTVLIALASKPLTIFELTAR